MANAGRPHRGFPPVGRVPVLESPAASFLRPLSDRRTFLEGRVIAMSDETLLVELFTEELPPKALRRLGEAFARNVAEGLAKREFCESNAAVSAFATPRRLAVQIESVRSESPAKAFEAKLMPVSVGMDANGTATPALLKKLSAMGIAESEAGKLTRK